MDTVGLINKEHFIKTIKHKKPSSEPSIDNIKKVQISSLKRMQLYINWSEG